MISNKTRSKSEGSIDNNNIIKVNNDIKINESMDEKHSTIKRMLAGITNSEMLRPARNYSGPASRDESISIESIYENPRLMPPLTSRQLSHSGHKKIKHGESNKIKRTTKEACCGFIKVLNYKSTRINALAKQKFIQEVIPNYKNYSYKAYLAEIIDRIGGYANTLNEVESSEVKGEERLDNAIKIMISAIINIIVTLFILSDDGGRSNTLNFITSLGPLIVSIYFMIKTVLNNKSNQITNENILDELDSINNLVKDIRRDAINNGG